MKRRWQFLAAVWILALLPFSKAVADEVPGRGLGGQTRTHYVAADEVAWDYAPSGLNQIWARPFTDEESTWVKSGQERIGKTYLKALWREYTDASFTTLKPLAPEWQHLGIMGPLVRAEVGDTIKFIFRNNTRLPYSVHPHGVFYEKNSEGAPYADGTSGFDKIDDAVLPGGDPYVHLAGP